MPQSQGQRMRPFTLDRTSHVNYDLWMISAIVLWIAFYLIIRSVSLAHGGHALAWDLGWYAEIAKNGYTFNGNPNQPQVVAFLPLYPFVLGVFLKLGVGIERALIIAPILLSIAGLWLIYRALVHVIPIADAFLLVLLFMGSPFSIYFLNGYSECLYLLLFGVFLFALLARKNHFLAALFAGVATAVRPHALVLFAVYLVWEFDRHRASEDGKEWVQSIALVAPLFVLGFLLTCVYYYFTFGDLFLYKNIMIAWGFDQFSDGFGAVIDHLRSQVLHLLVPDLRGLIIGFAPEMAKLQLWSFVVLALVFWRRLPKPVLAYGVVIVAFALLATIGSVNLGRHMATNIALPALLVVLTSALSRQVSVGEVRAYERFFHWLRYSFIATLLIAGLVVQATFIHRFFTLQWVS